MEIIIRVSKKEEKDLLKYYESYPVFEEEFKEALDYYNLEIPEIKLFQIELK